MADPLLHDAVRRQSNRILDAFGLKILVDVGIRGRGSIRFWRSARRTRLLRALLGFPSIAPSSLMTSFLPDEEGAQLHFEFEQELARLKAA
jgi:hypothetical protein